MKQKLAHKLNLAAVIPIRPPPPPPLGLLVAVDGQYTVLQLVRALAAVYKAGAARALPVYSDCELLHHAGKTLDVEVRRLPDEAEGQSMLIAEHVDDAFDFCYSPTTKELWSAEAQPPALKAKLGYRRKQSVHSYG